MRKDLSPARRMPWKGVGQRADSRMMPEGLVAKNRCGAAASPTSSGIETGMTAPVCLLLPTDKGAGHPPERVRVHTVTLDE